jgi:hypothetical protein
MCKDPAVLLRLLATSRALGDEAAAAARGRLRLTLDCKGRYGSSDLGNDDPSLSGDEDSSSSDDGNELSRKTRKRLWREQAAFVERRGALLAKLTVAERSHWDPDPLFSRHWDRPIKDVLAPALQRAAAAGRLRGLRAFAAPGFELECGLLGALALCPALTRLRLGDIKDVGSCVHVDDGHPSVGQLRAVGGQLAALRGLRELDLAFGCEPPAAPALAGLSALTRLTRLRLLLAGEFYCQEEIQMTAKWSGLHMLPASLLDLTLDASCQVRGVRVQRKAAGCLRWFYLCATTLAALSCGRGIAAFGAFARGGCGNWANKPTRDGRPPHCAPCPRTPLLGRKNCTARLGPSSPAC